MITAHIEKFMFEEKLRLCIIKHRGNTLAVSNELSLLADLVQKYVKKMEGKWSRDVSFHMASSIMSQLLLGHDSRIYHLQKCLEYLDGKEESKVSKCCGFLYEERKPRRITHTFCLKCGEKCFVETIDRAAIYKLKFRTLELLRDEDAHLVEFAKNMGFANPDMPAPPVVRNQVLIVSNKENDKFVKNASSLSPMDREKLRKQLQEHILGNEE